MAHGRAKVGINK